MVVIFLPTAAETGIEQDRTGAPSMCTVQAPHWAMPHPYFLPVRPSCSRSTQSSGVSGSTSIVIERPLMSSLAMRGTLLVGTRLEFCALYAEYLPIPCTPTSKDCHSTNGHRSTIVACSYSAPDDNPEDSSTRR